MPLLRRAVRVLVDVRQPEPAIDGGGGAAAPQPRTAEEAAFLAGLRAKMTVLSEAELEEGVAALDRVLTRLSAGS